jgi:hypothetical protein
MLVVAVGEAATQALEPVVLAVLGGVAMAARLIARPTQHPEQQILVVEVVEVVETQVVMVQVAVLAL